MKNLYILLLFAINICVTPLYAQSQGLPKVMVIATGGTIAGSAESNATTNYKPGVLSVDQILASVKGVDRIAEIESSQYMNIASQNLTTAEQLRLAAFVEKVLRRADISGVVITHGTDTMEESAYLLSLVISSDKPVVFVGAMRPSTGLGADGPANLYAASVAAASPESRGRGAMVVMNDDIILARDVVKFNTIKTDAFKAPNGAVIGSVVNSRAEYIYPAVERECFDSIPRASQPLPKVAILYGHIDSEPKLVDLLLAEGYKGIVFAGVGHGNMNDETLAALARAAKSGVAIVRASRIATGEVNSQGEVDDAKYGFTSSQRLNPAKARVLLQLALIEAKGNGAEALDLFDGMKY